MEKNLLPEVIYENLPDFLKALTVPFENRERDIVLLSSLGVISACLPKVFGIYANSKLATNLFVLVIAPPASGKGSLNKSRKLIEKIHETLKRNSLLQKNICEDEKKDSKDKFKPCPELEIKLLPGNVSSSKIYKHLQISQYGLLIFESEADSLSQMFKQDWGNFSDVLRKTFHHESISISREVDDKFFEVNYPQLSMVIAGTPNQVKPLIHSKENGLFSRFLFYYFNEPSHWKDVSPNGHTINTEELFTNSGEELFRFYYRLLMLENEIEIKLTNQQWEKFNATMSTITESAIHESISEILPIIKRQGVIFFRIAMILTMIRNINNPYLENITYCDDLDFKTSLELIKQTIDHSLKVSVLLTEKASPKEQLNARELIMLSHLPNNFTRNDALAIATNFNIPERTLGHILKKMVELKIIRRISNGNYQKNT